MLKHESSRHPAHAPLGVAHETRDEFLVGGILQLDHCQRESVEEQYDVRPPRVLVLRDRELVDGQPVVVLGALEVDDLRLRAGDRPVGAPVLDRRAVSEQAVQSTVVWPAVISTLPWAGRVKLR